MIDSLFAVTESHSYDSHNNLGGTMLRHLLILIAFLSSATFANADSASVSKKWLCGPDAWGEASPFSLFIRHDVDHQNTDCEGRVAVGGNAIFKHYSLGRRVSFNIEQKYTLVVGGSLWFEDGSFFGGPIWCGGGSHLKNYSHHFATHCGKRNHHLQPPVHFSQSFSRMESLSLYWSSLAANGKVLRMGDELIFKTETVDSSSRWYHLVVDHAELSEAQSIRFEIPPNSHVLVTVTGHGRAVLSNMGMKLGGLSAAQIVWHFPQATLLSIRNTRLSGVVFAPSTDVDFVDGLIEGKLIGKSLIGNGQINQAQFSACVPAPIR